jgi:hypothetical protein
MDYTDLGKYRLFFGMDEDGMRPPNADGPRRVAKARPRERGQPLGHLSSGKKHRRPIFLNRSNRSF